MHTQLRFARTPVLTLLIFFIGISRLAAQNAVPVTDEEEEDTISSYAAPVLRMHKSEFVDMGAEGIRCTLTLANPGAAPLTVNALEWEETGEYSIPAPPSLPFVIEPQGTLDLGVRYDGSRPITELPPNTLLVTSDSRSPMSFVVLIDLSRSMILDAIQCNGQDRLRLDVAKEHTLQFLNDAILDLPELGVRDELAIMAYSNDPLVVLPLSDVTPSVRTNAAQQINDLQAISGTHTGKALSGTIDLLSAGKHTTKAIILLTDGESSDLDKSNYPPDSIAQKAVASGITMYAVAVGIDDSGVADYLRTMTLPTDGLTLEADDCTSLGTRLRRISAASHSNTVDREPFPTGMTLSAPAESPRITSSIAVTDIAPNPGRDRIEVTVRTDGTARSELVFYNAQGEQVGEPITERISAAGEHRLSVDVRSFPAGVYVAVLRTTAGERHSMKFTLVK